MSDDASRRLALVLPPAPEDRGSHTEVGGAEHGRTMDSAGNPTLAHRSVRYDIALALQHELAQIGYVSMALYGPFDGLYKLFVQDEEARLTRAELHALCVQAVRPVV